MHSPEETIAALSTPPGRGGIAVIRLSGPEALSCARSVFTPAGGAEVRPGRVAYGSLRGVGGGDLDTGYLAWHPAGRSYTGEDVVELSCHGSPVLVEEILAALLSAGARAAHPGEFTYRAVLRGRLDLAQAEGVRDLIEAPTTLAARVAHAQVRGDLSRRVGAIRDDLIETISRAEASLEFAEEPEVAGAPSRIGRDLEDLVERVARFIDGYRQGRLLRDGARVVLAGPPNAGKSSLFNRLLRAERAIVAPSPGTTRDFLSERIDLNGIPVTLIDTAGLRAGAAGVEAEGVERSLRRIEEADLVLVLIPCDEEPDPESIELARRRNGSGLVVASKSDLALQAGASRAAAVAGAVRVSAATGEGIEALREAIFRSLARAPVLAPEEILISDARHHEALCRCRDRLRLASEALASGASEEVALVDLYRALGHLGEITGEVKLDEIYDRIFTTFCIGK
jgi:tRNA modification GTPase